MSFGEKVALFFIFVALLLVSAAADSTAYMFTSPYCTPCQLIKPIVAELQADGYDIIIIDISTRDGRKIARTYDVKGVPTLVIRINGQKILEKPGVLTLEEYKALVPKKGWFS